jgi:tRNA 5-methylaminomethyl-2-thiouridine biosynthesis bifunctional protein
MWTEGVLKSLVYDDIYYNTVDGIEEANYVFLQGNDVSSRLANNDIQTIAETGFGTGLNFLNTAQAFQDIITNGDRLHFISAEKFPLDKSALQKIYNEWPQFKEITDQLLPQYPPQAAGFHRISLLEGKIQLTLMLGDATDCLSKLVATVDAWYLDGFSPTKNPDMWTPALFEQIAALSKYGTTLATFTSASRIRRSLQETGFDIKKRPGFGLKREIIAGSFVGPSKKSTMENPWFSIPQTERPTHATIIGGGLAGCSTAYALAQRGIQVTIIEKASSLASGGSGNRQGALYAKLPITLTKQGELHLTGFLHSVNFLKQIDPKQSFWSQCGVAQLATTDKEDKKQQALISNGHYPDELVLHKSAAELSSIAGSEIRHNGLFFPTAGWVSPVEFCKSLTSHPNINIVQNRISSIEYSDNQWLLSNTVGKQYQCTHLILCNAELANQFTETSHLPLKTIRGQVSITQREAQLTELKTVVCGDGYISPSLHNQFCFGATFDLKGKTLDITDTDHQKNLVKLSNALPNFHQELISSNTALDGRTAYRCSTPDYMPVVGPTPIYNNYVDQYAKLRKDKNWRFENSAPQHHPNLFINTGHGSKGLITCPISAELLASMICNEPLPLPKDLIDAINPSRFIIKNLIKQAI